MSQSLSRTVSAILMSAVGLVALNSASTTASAQSVRHLDGASRIPVVVEDGTRAPSPWQFEDEAVSDDLPMIPFRPHPPTDLAVTDKRVVHANLDHYISYAVTFENRGPYATLGNRTYQLISFDANWNQTVHSGGSIKTGMAPGEKSESSPIQTNINAKLIWFVVLDGKDNNGWNDFMLLYDNR